MWIFYFHSILLSICENFIYDNFNGTSVGKTRASNIVVHHQLYDQSNGFSIFGVCWDSHIVDESCVTHNINIVAVFGWLIYYFAAQIDESPFVHSLRLLSLIIINNTQMHWFGKKWFQWKSMIVHKNGEQWSNTREKSENIYSQYR